MVALMFTAAFGTLAISFWPYMIPFSIYAGAERRSR
jgi:cytochrome bd ubiquinol oxidase subunit II